MTSILSTATTTATTTVYTLIPLSRAPSASRLHEEAMSSVRVERIPAPLGLVPALPLAMSAAPLGERLRPAAVYLCTDSAPMPAGRADAAARERAREYIDAAVWTVADGVVTPYSLADGGGWPQPSICTELVDARFVGGCP